MSCTEAAAGRQRQLVVVGEGPLGALLAAADERARWRAAVGVPQLDDVALVGRDERLLVGRVADAPDRAFMLAEHATAAAGHVPQPDFAIAAARRQDAVGAEGDVAHGGRGVGDPLLGAAGQGPHVEAAVARGGGQPLAVGRDGDLRVADLAVGHGMAAGARQIPQLDAAVAAQERELVALVGQRQLGHVLAAATAQRLLVTVARPQPHRRVLAPQEQPSVGQEVGARHPVPDALGDAAALRLGEDGLRRAPIAGVGILLEPRQRGRRIVVERLLRLRQHQLARALLGLGLRRARLGALLAGGVTLVGDARHRQRSRHDERGQQRHAHRHRGAMALDPAAHHLHRRIAVGADELAALEAAPDLRRTRAPSDSGPPDRAPSPFRRW